MISSGPRQIGDAALLLREVTRADSEHLYRWRVDPASREMFRTREEPSRAMHESFLAAYFEPANRDRWFVAEASGVPVGAIALYSFSDDGRQAEWGRLVIAPGQRGKGHGRRALELLIAHARSLGVSRLVCGVVAGNVAAERLYERCGFREVSREIADGREYRTLELGIPTGFPPSADR